MYRRLRNADRSRLRGAAATVILVILCCTNPTPPPDQAAILSMVTQDTSLSIYDTLRIPVIAIDFNEKIAAYNLTIDSVNVKGMTGTFISVSFTDTGKHTVSVEAIDTRGGKSLPVTINVRVFASPPAARISLIDTGSVNTTITAESHASDADGKTTAFLWAVDSAVFDTSADSTRQFVWKPDDYGIHTIYSKVIDDDRLVSECDSATIFIHEYRPVIQALADTVVSVNDSFNIDVTASDTNGSVIGYVWRRGISAPETTSLPRLRLLYPSDSAGPDTIRVYALDNDGIRSGTDTIIVDVHSYVPFVIPIADTVVAVFDTAYLHATAKDTNGTVTALLWSMDKIKWDTLPPSRSWNVFFPDSAYGIKTVFARAFDDDSLVSPIDSFNLDVRLYRPLIKAMDDTNVATNDTVLLHASASDTNGEIRRYVWTRLDGHRDTITGSLTKAFFTRNDTGVSLFTVCAFDDDSLASPVDTISVNVHLYRPTVVAMADTDVAINDTITLHASASDTNGSIKGYIWIRPDGHRDTSGNIFKTLFPQKDTGAWIFKVAAIDDDTMASPEDSVRVTVHLYRPDVSIRGDTIFSMYDTVTIGAEGLDTNGTILHYCWSTGNGTFGDTSSGPLHRFTWSDTGTKRIYVKVIDHDGLVSETDSIRITVIWDTLCSIGALRIDSDTLLLKRSVMNRGNSYRLSRFFEKCRQKKPITAGYIGGSITEGALASAIDKTYPWRYKCFISSLFPSTPVSVVNAGLSATNSRFACSRASKDLLAKNPDLIVIEFAVNDDWSDSAHTTANMEGLVRQCLKNPDAAVMMIFTFTNSGDSLNQYYHYLVAKHYGIPAVSYRKAFWPPLIDGQLLLTDISPDGIHPNDNGHLAISYLMYNFMKDEYIRYLRNVNRYPSGVENPLTVSGAFNTDLYEFAGFQDSTDTTVKIVERSHWAVIPKEYGRYWYETSKNSDSLVLITNAREVEIGYRFTSAYDSRVVIMNNGEFINVLSNYFADDWGGGFMKLFRIYEKDKNETNRIVIHHIDNNYFRIEYVLYAN